MNRMLARCLPLVLAGSLGPLAMTGAPALATTSTVTNWDGLQRDVEEPTITRIELDAGLDASTVVGALTLKIVGDKVLAGDTASLPRMEICSATGDILTIEGGVFGEDAFAAIDTNGTAGTGWVLRVHGESKLRLQDSKIESPEVADNSLGPTTLVEVHSSSGGECGAYGSGTGGTVTLAGVWNTEDSPLTHALVVTADRVPQASSVTITQATLYLGQHAVLHGNYFPEATADTVGAGAEVTLRHSYLRWASAVDTDHVGMGPFDTGSGVVPAMPLLASADRLDVHGSRLTGLRTQNLPLFQAPYVTLDQVMVDDFTFMNNAGAEAGSIGSVVVGNNVLVGRSLMCAVGGEPSSLFAAVRNADADPELGVNAYSVHVLNSAFWDVDQSLFDIDIGPSGWDSPDYGDDSALVAANITLERPMVSAGGSSGQLYPMDVDTPPRLRVQNSYLQGVWGLDVDAERTEMEAVVRYSPDQSEPCAGHAASECLAVEHSLLAEDALASNCTAVMDNLSGPLFTELDGRTVMRDDRKLIDLTPDDLEEPEVRPKLVGVGALDVAGIGWVHPEPYGDWDSLEACVVPAAAMVGAWSGESDPCSLPLLEPDLEGSGSSSTPWDSGGPTADSGGGGGVDSGAGEPSAVDTDDVEAGKAYGLGSGCRYSGAAVWLVLPLALRRRRRTA